MCQIQNKPSVSVIIPIYNVEKYIERCVRSLMEQTLEDIEFIFVNDCTPDKSIDILNRVIKEYPKRQKFIHIINHETNKGSAAVRNTGLNASTGEYIIHCDTDDWVDPNMYKAMYNKAKETNADIICTDFYNEYADHSSIQKQLFPDNNIECIKLMLAGQLHCATWNKLIRKEIYTKNNIHFPNKINLWEDVLTIIPLFFYANNIVYLPKSYYHYVRYNTNSYTKQLSSQSLNNLVSAITILDSFFHKTNSYSLFQDSFCYLKLTVKLNLLIHSEGALQKEWNKLYPEANKKISSYKALSWYWRIALSAARYNIRIFNMLVYISRKIKR